MVSASAATLDMGDDTLGGRLGGDPDDRTDLLDGAGLEADVRDTGVMQFIDQRDGILKIRNTGTDDKTVDRRTGLTRFLNQSLPADLQLPQIRIEKQRVELDCAAGLEQCAQFSHPPIEDRFGDLTAAGEFGPVPGIGGGGDDLRIDGRRRHPGQQDR